MREISILKQRILLFLDKKGISKYECYKNTGITNGVLSQSNGMSEENILKFLSYYKEVRPEWLFCGKEPMLCDQDQERQSLSIDIDTTPKFGLVRIPVVDISVAAGSGTYNSNYMQEVECISMPRSMVRDSKVYLCVRIKGHSMTPSIMDGGYLIIYNVEKQEWSDLRDNYVYVVCDNEGRSFVKRIKNRFKEHGFIVLMSDNPDKQNYPNFNLQEDEINTIWFAEWYFTARITNIQETFGHKLSEIEGRVDDLVAQVQQINRAISSNSQH